MISCRDGFFAGGFFLAFAVLARPAIGQPVECNTLLTRAKPSLSAESRALLFGPTCYSTRHQAVVEKLSTRAPAANDELMQLQRLADELDSEEIFTRAIDVFRNASHDDETRLLHLWIAGKQAYLPKARGAVLRRELGYDAQIRMRCVGEFVAERPKSTINMARSEFIGRSISEIASTETMSSELRLGLSCFQLALPKPPPILPGNLSAAYDCDNRFWLSISDGLMGGRRSSGPAIDLRRPSQPDSTIKVPFGGPFPFEMPTADNIELWYEGELVKRVAHRHQSCTAKLHRASGRPLPAGTDTLAWWEWRTAAQISEDGRSTQRIRR